MSLLSTSATRRARSARRLYAGLLTVLLGAGSPALGQWKATYADNQRLDTLYALQSSRQHPFTAAYYFPEYDAYENSSPLGCPLIAGRGTAARGAGAPVTYQWSAAPQGAGRIRRDTTCLSHRLYLRNVKQYTIAVYDPAQGRQYTKSFTVEYDGYQEPFTEAVSGWPASAAAPAGAGGSGLRLTLTAVPRREGEYTELTANRLVLFNQVRTEYEARHPFFGRLTGTAPASASPARPVLISGYLASQPAEYGQELVHSTINLVNAAPAGTPAESRLFTDLIRQAIEQYQFYGEKKLEKSDVLRDYDALVQRLGSPDSLCQVVAAVGAFVDNTFRDRHFTVKAGPATCRPAAAPKTTKRPVRLYLINGGVYVAAVFDTLYRHSVPVGSRVLAIDRVPVQQVIGRRADREGTAEELTEGLDKPAGDSLVLTLADPSAGTREVVVRYAGKQVVPENFKPRHAEFRMLDQSVAYFKINNWFMDVYLRFINHREQLEDARGLVIDLRGNGGGSIVSVIRMLSVFTGTPHVVYTSGEPGRESPLVVKPNPYYRFAAGKPVVILCDKNTACASEVFMEAMRALPNVKTVGTDKTMGALALRYDVHFPSGAVVYLDCVAPKYHLPRGVVVESVGLKPDVEVPIRSVRDLRPYDDKVLKVALDQITKNS